MKQPIRVVMLPTGYEPKVGDLCTSVRHGKKPLIFGEFENSYQIECKKQHLYITVSQDVEPIKDGDWCILFDSVGNVFSNPQQYKPKKGHVLNKDLRQVIATTDPKLIYYKDSTVGVVGMSKIRVIIPQVQQSFLKEFVANPDGKWEVEYEFIKTTIKGVKCDTAKLQLKINQDNTVNITSVKEKMYNLDEIKQIVFNILFETNEFDENEINNIIKENL